MLCFFLVNVLQFSASVQFSWYAKLAPKETGHTKESRYIFYWYVPNQWIVLFQSSDWLLKLGIVFAIPS